MASTIHRSERICIDIRENTVNIIKLDPDGVMLRAGSAKAPPMPASPNDAYVTDLSSAIRKAAWAAKVSMAFGASCVIVSSLPNVVLQRFTWPDMPEEALIPIAHEEIVPYLPGPLEHFSIGCEVLKQSQSGGAAMIEVLVAAMPIEHSSAMATACKWANFKPKRMDLRENARGRLAHYWCAPVEGEVPTTFAILDVAPGFANIAFYYNGMFHSNRYFTPEMVKLEEVDDFELLMSVKGGGVDDNQNAMHYDPGRLSDDIISAINHFHRLVPGSKLQCALLMAEENIPGVEDHLRAKLDMLVLKPSQWVSPGAKRPNLRRVDQAQFLDAFAAGMPALSNHGTRMDLRMPESAVGPADRVVFQQAVAEAGAAATPPPHEHAVPPVMPPLVHEPPTMVPLPAHTPAGYGDPFASHGPRPFDEPFAPREPAFGSEAPFTDPFAPREPLFQSEAPFAETTAPRDSDFDNLFTEMDPTPEPIGYSDTPFSARPAEPPGLDLSDIYADPPPLHHEVPFDAIKPDVPDKGGFPYAIPEDPKPQRSLKPMLLALAVVAAIFIVAVLIPFQETRNLRSELQYLENSIGAHISADAIRILTREIIDTETQIAAVRRDISRLSGRMEHIRNFYQQHPAMYVVPRIMDQPDFGVQSITSNGHNVTIVGSTRNLIALGTGVPRLRDVVFAGHPLNFDLEPGVNDTGIDEQGYAHYTIIIRFNPPSSPIWLNQYEGRRWQ